MIFQQNKNNLDIFIRFKCFHKRGVKILEPDEDVQIVLILLKYHSPHLVLLNACTFHFTVLIHFDEY